MCKCSLPQLSPGCLLNQLIRSRHSNATKRPPKLYDKSLRATCTPGTAPPHSPLSLPVCLASRSKDEMINHEGSLFHWAWATSRGIASPWAHKKTQSTEETPPG